MTQAEALTILKTGRNVFITGPAGSGKTYVVNEYIKYLKDHSVPIGITASTGIAATHMGGMTIHSWSGIGIKDSLTDRDLEELLEKANLRKRIEAAQVLIIDEVSMLHHYRLDLIEQVTRHIKKNDKPFGGLQIVLCGDFFQLPPVSRMGEAKPYFIYRSEAWRDGKFTVCYLSENYRQGDDQSASILNEIRSGEVSDGAREQLKSRYRGKDLIVLEGGTIEPTRLYTHNADVDGVNDTELAKVDGPEISYEMISKGKKPLVDVLKKSCLAPEILRLRKGARVMCVKNNFEQGYVNGTLGIVESCGPGVDPVIRTARGNKRVAIEMASWKIEENGKVLAEINQYPLRLAWAITVHKSQGMSLDAIEVDLSRSFEPGMGYVALSRVRTLDGLTILGMNEMALHVHPDVLVYDRHLRQLSDKAESSLSGTDTAVITRLHQEFLAKVAPLHSMQEGKGGSMKVSTFEKTAVLVRAEKSLSKMALEREMTVETIISHIEKLITQGSEAGGLAMSDIYYLKKEIPSAHFKKIEQAFEEVIDAMNEEDEEGEDNQDKMPALSPVKNKVGPNISFREIQLARVLLGYVKRK